ncbi:MULTISPECIES: PTS sugar transporter subunit IIA [Neobacillus]|uniref:PTS glucose transporter subunit IIA n=1 Tax=Neobacillus citreus TaxID=2833578 RepID=A0A942YB18_9BACI|nr:PTS glucose transporter subunit IIA [Neobacillus citreus]MCH6268576.1 PTS glucose transporter subunit IIA [Neobacillus citreus]
MFEKLFKKKGKPEVEIYSPLDGKVVSLEEVPDPVFSEKMMGDGVAVIPSAGKLVAPVDGEVIQVFPTKHAIGIKSVNGLELLIHIGLDTVQLNGEGFQVYVEQGQSVKVGDLLVNFDIPFIKSNNKEIVTPIIITNMAERVETIVQNRLEEVTREDLLFTCNLKF